MGDLNKSLVSILSGYGDARKHQFARNPMADFIRNEAAEAVEQALDTQRAGMLVVGSAGAGNWASVPWISVFDTAITETATKGYYVVYLFHHSEPIVHLSLNQGTTAVRKEFGTQARSIMRYRANLMQQRVADIATDFSTAPIQLGSSKELPLDYEAGHALGKSYHLAELPEEDELAIDLRKLVQVYRSLTFRGGLDQAPEDLRRDVPIDEAILEQRRYRLHLRIERNSAASRMAKAHHGTRCQACDLEFSERYGTIGEGFIEAHHLKPLSSLADGAIVSYDLTDFAVLCPNCHRMIHRWIDPGDIDGFRTHVLSSSRRGA